MKNYLYSRFMAFQIWHEPFDAYETLICQTTELFLRSVRQIESAEAVINHYRLLQEKSGQRAATDFAVAHVTVLYAEEAQRVVTRSRLHHTYGFVRTEQFEDEELLEDQEQSDD